MVTEQKHQKFDLTSLCAAILVAVALLVVGTIAFVIGGIESRRQQHNREQLGALSPQNVEMAAAALDRRIGRCKITQASPQVFSGSNWRVKAIAIQCVRGDPPGPSADPHVSGSIVEGARMLVILADDDIHGAAKDLGRVLASQRARLATHEDVEAVRALWVHALPWRQKVFVEQTIPERRITIVSYEGHSVYTLDIMLDADSYVQSAEFRGTYYGHRLDDRR